MEENTVPVENIEETKESKLKEAYGERFSQIDVTDTNDTASQLRTDQSEEKELADMKPALPRSQKKVKLSK